MLKKSLQVLSICVFLVCFAVCAPVVPPTPGPVHLKVVIAPFLSYAPFFLGADYGYFAEQGLDVEFVRFANDSQALPGLIAGEVDVSAGILAVNQFNAIARGSDIKMVADKGYHDPNGCVANAIVVQKSLLDSHKLDTPDGYRGLRVNYREGAYTTYIVDAFLASKGLTIRDMQTQNLPEPSGTQALVNGSIDLAYSGEPNLTIALNSGKVVMVDRLENVTADKQLATVVYGPNLLKKNPDAGRRFMVAYLKSVAQYQQGKTDRNLDIIAKYTGLDRDLIKQACWQPIRAEGTIDTGTAMNFQKWAIERKLLDQMATPEQFWDPSFIEYAKRR